MHRVPGLLFSDYCARPAQFITKDRKGMYELVIPSLSYRHETYIVVSPIIFTKYSSDGMWMSRYEFVYAVFSNGEIGWISV